MTIQGTGRASGRALKELVWQPVVHERMKPRAAGPTICSHGMMLLILETKVDVRWFRTRGVADVNFRTAVEIHFRQRFYLMGTPAPRPELDKADRTVGKDRWREAGDQLRVCPP